jgi:hypothetical protein
MSYHEVTMKGYVTRMHACHVWVGGLMFGFHHFRDVQ